MARKVVKGAAVVKGERGGGGGGKFNSHEFDFLSKLLSVI
jgi:hypothetical protein